MPSSARRTRALPNPPVYPPSDTASPQFYGAFKANQYRPVCTLWIQKPEEQVTRGRGNRNAIGTVGGRNDITTGSPASRVGQIVVLEQGIAAGVRPENSHTAAPVGHDDQIRSARRLYRGHQA